MVMVDIRNSPDGASMIRVGLLTAAALVFAVACFAAAAGAAPAPGSHAPHGRLAHVAKPLVLHEHVASQGVYDVTVTLTARRRAAGPLRVTIGTVLRRAMTTAVKRHAVVSLRLRIAAHRLTIRVSSARRAPRVAVRLRRIAAKTKAVAPPASPAPATGATATALPPAVPNPIEVGVNAAATSGDFFTAPAVIDALAASRPAWVRMFVGWNAIEPQQGVYNTAEIADYVSFLDALPPGTQVDIDVEGTPTWAAGGSSNTATPPSDNADYTSFLEYLAGAFAGHVAAWEIWNEEASPGWWDGTPAQFASLLEAAYPVIKALDPHSTVILGASDPTFLAELYAAGAQGSFDAVAVHTDTACNITSPYVFEDDPGTTTIDQYFFLGFTGIHAIMVADGDGAKPIYMTEIGWSSTDAECSTGLWAGQKLGGVTEQIQATYLQQAYHCLAQPQYSYVKAAMWFELFDNADSTDPTDNYGLLDNSYNPKPAFTAFEQESLDGDQLTGPCG
jgi:hypothetical protein